MGARPPHRSGATGYGPVSSSVELCWRNGGSADKITLPDHPNSMSGGTSVISPYSVAFLLIHLGCFASLWTGVTARALELGFALYVVRIFAVGAGYHRYFAHRAFRTSRTFQFGLAFLSLTSAQRGILWWAAKHRQHHMHSPLTPTMTYTRRSSAAFSMPISAGFFWHGMTTPTTAWFVT
jgi:hypothetical protein